MQEQELKELFEKYLKNTCSEEEVRIYFNYFDTDAETCMRKFIREELEKDSVPQNLEEEVLLADIVSEIYNDIEITLDFNKIYRPFYSFKKFWRSVAAVAAVLTFLVLSTYYIIYEQESPVFHRHSQNHIDDLPPGTYSALLTLSDGSRIDLKDIDGGIRIGGDISYDDGEIITKATSGDLKLTVPRGGTYQLTLEDGTQVWLNSDSELIYPSHFATNNRKVELRGEAYFKVSKDRKRPFYVRSLDQQIRVIGTEFNVNSYPENRRAVTTLVEGSVQIVDTKTNQNKMLVPGEQSIVGESSIKVNKVDVASIVSWKKGQFNFENKSLKAIMDEFSRWYDIEVQYQGVVPSVNLYGDINRDVNLSFALQVLESAGIKYKLKGRVVTVSGSNK